MPSEDPGPSALHCSRGRGIHSCSSSSSVWFSLPPSCLIVGSPGIDHSLPSTHNEHESSQTRSCAWADAH